MRAETPHMGALGNSEKSDVMKEASCRGIIRTIYWELKIKSDAFRKNFEG